MNLFRSFSIGSDGSLRFVYFDGFVYDIGEPTIRRATNIEWEDGQWVARKPCGDVIASDVSRAACVSAEIAHLNEEIVCGREI